jgi:formylglycine-generating enzyme required for sulfatase activity
MFPVVALVLGIGDKVLINSSGEVTAYSIDRTEVSIVEFTSFEKGGGYTQDNLWSPEGLIWRKSHPDGAGANQRRSDRTDDHPVVAISFFEAEAYCAWKGGQLPTNAQWTRAVCATTPFPWGASQDAPAAWYSDGKHGHLDSVATQPANQQSPELEGPYGILHGAGNVWEWTVNQPVKGQNFRSLRGGSYANLPSYCACNSIAPALPSDTRLTTGVRCVYP